MSLTTDGAQQAEALGRRLRGVPLSAVVASPLLRCQDTAWAIARAHDVQGLSVSTDDGFVECDYGDWTNRPLADLADEPLWKTVQASPSLAEFPGGESLAAMSARAVDAAVRTHRRVTAEHGEAAVCLVVTHGDIIKAIVADALGMHVDAFQRLIIHTASLSVVQYGSTGKAVLRFNDTGDSLNISSASPESQSTVGGQTR